VPREKQLAFNDLTPARDLLSDLDALAADHPRRLQMERVKKRRKSRGWDKIDPQAPLKAYDFASRLTGTGLRKALVDDVAEWFLLVCRNEDEAEAIYKEALWEGKKWTCLKDLDALYTALFPPPERCGLCFATGVEKTGVGSFRWCECPAGLRRKVRSPDLLQRVRSGEVDVGDILPFEDLL
jgi:hypothetical protein